MRIFTVGERKKKKKFIRNSCLQKFPLLSHALRLDQTMLLTLLVIMNMGSKRYFCFLNVYLRIPILQYISGIVAETQKDWSLASKLRIWWLFKNCGKLSTLSLIKLTPLFIITGGTSTGAAVYLCVTMNDVIHIFIWGRYYQLVVAMNYVRVNSDGTLARLI